ncbi:serine protease snake-like [Musca vetustissima]|uniref:serine protease snake-like n=1 Tax=Musca vetustissima TaxID=27455 RepID=UPI002AB609B2|nr:serine protease snake-like [Musca vetustissima]
MPFNCYTSGYDNIVCCPEAYVGPKNRKPPTVIESAENHPFLSNTHMSLNVRTRRSEVECEAIYNPYSRSHRRRHRSRRSSNNNSSQVENDEVNEPPTHDEIIIKKKVQDTEVVGGIAAHKNEFPYMCALGWRQSSSRRSEIRYHCGCVLIAPKYVLTVAHCADFGGESPKIVRLGGGDLNGRDDEMIRIRRIIQHPDYDSNYAYNDIAVVKLEKRSRIRPSCLWPNEGLPQEVVTAIGYGQTKFGEFPLMYTHLKNI